MILVSQLISKIQEDSDRGVRFFKGNPEIGLEKIIPVSGFHDQNPSTDTVKSLVFCSKLNDFTKALIKKPTLLVLHHSLEQEPDVQAQLATFDWNNRAVFFCKDIKLAMATLFPLFTFHTEASQQIHKTAMIHPTALIGKSVTIDAYVVIKAHVQIADHCHIGPHCIIEEHSHIGASSKLHGFVFIGHHTKIGRECEIHAHTTLGSDGFGYATQADGAPGNFRHLKIPQLGNVVLEDRVEIGAHCAIDRATLESTRIKSGTKLDNLCHIAHNCEIGSDSLLAAGFMVAGSTQIGKGFMCGGSVAIADHINVPDNVILAGRSTLTSQLKEPGAYGGHPVQPMREYLKNLTVVPQLLELKKQVNELVKNLNLEKKQK